MGIEITYAGFWRRFIAWIIDVVILIPLLILITFLIAESGIMAEQGGALLIYLTWLFASSFYVIRFWALRGQTLGKMLMRIKIVRSDMGSISGGTSILRFIALISPFLLIIIISLSLALFIGKYALGYLLYFGIPAAPVLIFIPFLWVIWDSNKQGLHDKFARTYVVKIHSKQRQ